MDQDAALPEPPAPESPVDLRALEDIERELNAVDAALQQIDAGVYHGFEGLDLSGTLDLEAPA